MHVSDLLRGRTASRRDRIYGVVVGIVKDIQDPENQGRIRVSYPWRVDETTQHVGEGSEEGDNVDSTWARMATLNAGDDRGTWFIPEIEDEVLLAFHHGDPQRPYIIGTLWHKGAMPPEQMDGDGKNHLRTIKSRSGHVIRFDDNLEDKTSKIEVTSSAGHTLVFDETDGEENVTLQTIGGHQLVFSDKSGAPKVEMTSSAGHTITLDDAPGGEKVTVADKSGSNQIEIDSVQNAIAIKSGVKLSIESTQIDIKASASMNIQSSGTLAIKGALVQIN